MFHRISKPDLLAFLVFLAVTVGIAQQLTAQRIIEPGFGNGFVEPQNPYTHS